MWEIITYSAVKARLKPYSHEYVLVIVEDESGNRLIAQLDTSLADTITIGTKGALRKTVGPLGEINRFIPSEHQDSSREQPLQPLIKTIGIIGTGNVGMQLAQFAAMHGLKTILKSRDARKLNSLTARVEKRLLKYLGPDDTTNVLKNMIFTSEYDKLMQADIIIDCIVENMEEKASLFKQLEDICPEETILATNTSSLSVSALSSQLLHPQRFIGIHFFNPIEKMRLVEIILVENTSEDTTNRAYYLAKTLDKVPIKIYDSPSGIVNRLLFLMINEAAYLVQSGLPVEDIDKAMEMGANYPMGPLKLADFVGIDITYEIIVNLAKSYPHMRKPAPIFDELLKKGDLGKKTGTGFYRYA
jgi:3-hydroxybutyryl-CoA dehydrogenase